jgi:ABC-type transport system substrate-binding protein
MKFFFLLFLVLSTIILPNVFAKDKYGGTLVYGRGVDAGTLDPASTTDNEVFTSTAALFDNLVQFKYGTTEIEPALATSWDISEDGLTYIFHLRKNVYFNKTKYFTKTVEFTADDVIFSLKRQFDKNNAYNNMGKDFYKYWNAMNMSDIVKDIVKVDKYTVKFLLKKKNAPFIANLSMSFASILSKTFANDLLKIGKKDDLNTLAVGTGPFYLVKWLKDDRIIYQRNENYWQGKPYLTRLIFKVIANSTIRAAELKTGSIHVMDSPNNADLKSLESHKNIKIVKQEALSVHYLALNLEKPPFNNIKVRKAINHAINRKAIVKTIYANQGTVAKNPIPPLQWGYNDDVKDYEYNPIKAKMLLKEANLENGFETYIYISPYLPIIKNLAVAMQSDLAKVGINLKIVSYNWNTFVQKISQGEHDMVIVDWTSDNGDPDNFLFTLLSKSSAIKPAQNFAFWKNDMFNDLIEEAKITSNLEKRIELYKKAQMIFKKDAPWVTIANPLTLVPLQKKVKGFKIDPIGKKRFHKVWID